MSTTVEQLKTYNPSEQLYSSQEARILGRLTLSQADVLLLPLNLDDIYQITLQELRASPVRAMNWARTYGMLSIGLALNSQATNFCLENVDAYPPPRFAELQTERKFPLASSLWTADRDSQTVFLLSDEGPERVEMSLIKALHMLDFGLVKGQLDLNEEENLPLVLAVAPDELWKLAYDQGAELRGYGNVRGLAGAPNLLGTVLPTSALESSGVTAYPIGGLSLRLAEKTARLPTRERINASAIGITTAKRPHIGHAFLLAKAVAQSGANGQLVIELNDQGPRVAQMVDSLAKLRGTSFEATASEISSGDVAIEEIETAYRQRSKKDAPSTLPRDFNLNSSNGYYRRLLNSIKPSEFSFVAIANSELPRDYVPDLVNLPAATRVFGGSGMTILASPEDQQALVVEAGGRLTAVGVVGALSTKYALNYVDSPRPLDSTAQKIFTASGLEMQQTPGMGVSINFKVASGTSGDSVLIESLLDKITEEGLPSQDFLSICRAMLNDAYFIEGDGASLNPNYASVEAVNEAFNQALNQLKLAGERVDIYQPLVLKRAGSKIARQVISNVCGDIAVAGRFSAGELRRALRGFPALEVSRQLREFVDNQENADEELVPKKLMKNSQNLKCLQGLRSGQLKFVFEQLEQMASSNPDQFLKAIKGTMVEDMMATMGYRVNDVLSFCNAIRNLKGEVYVAS